MSAKTYTAEEYEEAIARILGFYESLGFKRVVNPQLSDLRADYPTQPGQRLTKIWGNRLNPDNPDIDVVILYEFFSEDAWYSDLECDVHPANLVYEQVLPEWAAISHGLFNPTDIKESWETESGPPTISFKHDGKTVTLHAQDFDDFIDIDILNPINELIAESGYSFEVGGEGQCALIICITADQKQKMIEGRNFQFSEDYTYVERPLVPLFLD